jgi:hypothetical protein
MSRPEGCICDYNPETTNGPEEHCPHHGRPYEYWVEGCFELSEQNRALREDVARLQALADLRMNRAIDAAMDADRLRSQVDAVETVLEDEEHGLYCDKHYGNACTCWHHKVAIITGYGMQP